MSSIKALLVILATSSLVLAQAPVTHHRAAHAARPAGPRRLNIMTIATLGGGQMSSDEGIPPPDPKVGSISRQNSNNCQNVRYAGTAVGQTGLIRSPNYPNAYPPNANCSYFVSSPANTQITLTCDINIVCAPSNDHIYWSLSGDPKFGDSRGFCGQGRIPTQTSQGNSLAIGFISQAGRRPPSRFTYNWQCRIRIIAARVPPSTTTVRPPPTTTTTRAPPTQQTTTIAPPTTAPPLPPPGATNCSCGVRNLEGVGRIVGGEQTRNHELPWRVTVFIYDVTSLTGGLCGGTVISQNWIMTAAHCLMNYKSDGSMNISVYTEAQNNPITVGDGVEFMVDRIVQHSGFSQSNFDNDIALLHLSRPIVYSAKVSPACLPQGPLSISDHNGVRVLASGWGTTKPVPAGQQSNDPVSDTLLEVELPVLTTAQCRAYQSVTDNQICTYEPGKDTCQGDSGGSIDFQYFNNRYYAIGITSFGYGCAQLNYPGGYTKVNNYLSWIQIKTGETFCLPSN